MGARYFDLSFKNVKSKQTQMYVAGTMYGAEGSWTLNSVFVLIDFCLKIENEKILQYALHVDECTLPKTLGSAILGLFKDIFF